MEVVAVKEGDSLAKRAEKPVEKRAVAKGVAMTVVRPGEVVVVRAALAAGATEVDLSVTVAPAVAAMATAAAVMAMVAAWAMAVRQG